MTDDLYRLMKGGVPNGRVPSNAGGLSERLKNAMQGHSVSTTSGASLPGGGAPLNCVDEDADKCCQRMFRAQDWASVPRMMECPACGTQFYPEMHLGVRYWRIKSNVVIVRR